MRLELNPERMVHGGRALARDPQGRVVLVGGALPGETVVAEVEQRSGVLMGETIEVLEPSPDRVDRPVHPGLDLAFASYAAQLRLKGEVLRDAARRAKVELPEPEVSIQPSPEPWHYRSAVQPAVRDGRLGYRSDGGQGFVALEQDPTANVGVQGAWRLLTETGLPGSVREVAIRGNDQGEALVALIATAPAKAYLDLAHRMVGDGIAGVALAPWDPRGRFRSGKSRLAGAREIRQRYGRFELSVSATAFAQPTPAAAGAAFEELAALAPGGARALDLFAGGGAIAFHLVDGYDEVVAIELASESVARGRRDAARLGLDKVRFERVDARHAELPPSETVAVDPPRSGLARELRARIDESEARSLLYLSCDVATWARDAADLVARGWRLAQVRPYDFQPHTHHLELLSAFER